MRKSMLTVGGCVLASSLFVVGCNRADEGRTVPKGDQQVAEPKHDHKHGHGHGPNGGHLVDLGGKHKLHAEVDFDQKTRKTTVYILGEDAKTPHPLDAGDTVELHLEGTPEIEVKFTAVPLEGETDGKSSRFEAAAGVPEAIKKEDDFEGHLHVKAGDEELSGDISHGDHDH